MASTSRLPSRRSRPMSMVELPTIKSDGATTSKQSKRRSLLPQFSRKFSGEKDTIKEDDETAEIASTCSSVKEDSDGEGERRMAQEVDRKAMPPPTSRLGRPTSVYNGGLGRATSVRTHARAAPTDARADALAALTGTVPAPTTTTTSTGLSRTASTRLPQSPSKGLSRTTSIRPREPAARSTTAEKRTSTTRSRPTSTNAKATARPPSITSPPSPSTSTTSRQSGRPQSQLFPPSSRPNFTTYQQHYSPAKSSLPKPPVPNPRSSKPLPSAPIEFEDAVPSFDVLKQQTELLQLSLLHQAALQTSHEYDASARRKLGRKQAKLRKEYEAIRAQEDEQKRIISLRVLDSWAHSDPALLAEGLQILSKVHNELTTITEKSGGRYGSLVVKFEEWILASGGDSTRHYIAALPSDWHKAHTSLALRLRSLQRNMSLLPPAPDQHPQDSQGHESPLHVLLEHCTTLLDGMLKELEVMGKLEKEILLREKARVDEEVAQVVDEEQLLDMKKPWVPAWQDVT
ncbi:hypothetical protein LTR86_007896 [Recurvomyces mirabilis]|nr:hypothetical protein LTR86_007896 [Recurvomyces mirabilis]